MILKRQNLYSSTKRTDYSSLDPVSSYWAKVRRRSDKGIQKDIKEIDKTTSGLEKATSNIIGNISKRDIRAKQAELRKTGNEMKLRRILR